MIISIQTYGDLLIWHPHIHCLVTDGVFNATGNFHPIPKIDTEKAMIIFREKVFKMLKDNNRISDTLIFKMRHWNHSGFSVNNEVYINKDNPEALERLAQYIVHSSFSADKIKYIEATGSVMYKSKMHLAKKRNFEALDAIEFIHRICLHIPDHYESLIRYYGYYSNAARGKRKKLGIENDIEDSIEIEFIDDAPFKQLCRKTWAQLIYKIYEVDPLRCPICNSRMKIIGFIQDRKEVEKIMRHIDIWPVEYPEMPADKRASPMNFKLNLDLLSKRIQSKHIN